MKKIDCDGFFVDEFGNRYVRCTNCEKETTEEQLEVDEDGEEICPFCNAVGCFMDLSPESVQILK